MGKIPFTKRFAVAFVALSLWAVPIVITAQAPCVTAPKNKYSTRDDVQLGQKAANEVERQFPLINDADAGDYLQGIGERLVAAIPPEFQHSDFNYRFKWVNASDLNA